MKICVTGGRAFTDVAAVFRVLDLLRPTHVAQGGAPGLDAIARDWCAVRGVACVTYPADWSLHGRRAGPIRNREMLSEERPDALIVFPGNAGTRDCKAQARAMGVLVLEVAA